MTSDAMLLAYVQRAIHSGTKQTELAVSLGEVRRLYKLCGMKIMVRA